VDDSFTTAWTIESATTGVYTIYVKKFNNLCTLTCSSINESFSTQTGSFVSGSTVPSAYHPNSTLYGIGPGTTVMARAVKTSGTFWFMCRLVINTVGGFRDQKNYIEPIISSTTSTFSNVTNIQIDGFSLSYVV